MPSLIVVALASTVVLMAVQPAGPMPNGPLPPPSAQGPSAPPPAMAPKHGPKTADMTPQERQARNAAKADHAQAKQARKAQADANKAARQTSPQPPY